MSHLSESTSDLCSWMLLASILASATLSVGVVGVPWIFGGRLRERVRNQLTRSSQCIAWGASLVLVIAEWSSARIGPLIVWANWLPADLPGAQFGLAVDRTSASLVLGVTTLVGVVQHFSFRYLHRDPGHERFFLLLATFQLGMLLLVSASHLVGLVAGWELVGVSSALLIAYFHQRRAPIENALLAFGSYRLCDVGLLVGSALLVHALGNPAILELGTLVQSSTAPTQELQAVAILFVIASLGKSAQLPLSPWFPRAMEGPTPSSAIFYGALSIHAGAYLLVRSYPILETSLGARVFLVLVGLGTAVYAALVGRSDSDIKCRLAHASMAQAGIILTEIGLGLPTLALWHVGAHACLRTWQFLRAPSALHDAHVSSQGHSEAAPSRSSRSPFGRSPFARTRRLYARRLDRFGLDDFVRSTCMKPLQALAELLVRSDPWSDSNTLSVTRGMHSWRDPRQLSAASEIQVASDRVPSESGALS